jgi:hypothetical protein
VDILAVKYGLTLWWLVGFVALRMFSDATIKSMPVMVLMAFGPAIWLAFVFFLIKALLFGARSLK